MTYEGKAQAYRTQIFKLENYANFFRHATRGREEGREDSSKEDSSYPDDDYLISIIIQYPDEDFGSEVSSMEETFDLLNLPPAASSLRIPL